MPAERNLALLAERAFERNGDYESLWFEGRWHRSGELRERAQRVAAGLIELGVTPGDRVVVFAAPEGWEPDALLAELLARFPDGASPPGMLAGMQSAGGRSLQA